VATAENKVFLEADLAPGKVYYVITRIYPGAWKARVAFLPVTKGSELWEEVLKYEQELQKLQPDQEKLNAWEKENKEKIQSVLKAYESGVKTQYNWPKLTLEDGR
jgi:hypothetical protein